MVPHFDWATPPRHRGAASPPEVAVLSRRNKGRRGQSSIGPNDASIVVPPIGSAEDIHRLCEALSDVAESGGDSDLREVDVTLPVGACGRGIRSAEARLYDWLFRRLPSIRTLRLRGDLSGLHRDSFEYRHCGSHFNHYAASLTSTEHRISRNATLVELSLRFELEPMVYNDSIGALARSGLVVLLAECGTDLPILRHR